MDFTFVKYMSHELAKKGILIMEEAIQETEQELKL